MKRSRGVLWQWLCVASLIAAPSAAHAQPRGACCSITAVDTRSGVVTAKEASSGKTFEFKARNPAATGTMKVGQAVYANFTNNQVSLDGRTVCCSITTPPTASNQANIRNGPLALPNIARNALPQVTYGTPVPAAQRTRSSGPIPRVFTRTIIATVRGREVRQQILQLNGRQGIRNSGLPDGARRLLEMHVRKLHLGESQMYFVDPQLAAQWAATHPIPASVKPKEESNESDSDCGTVSINGIVDCAQDAAQAVADEYERNRKKAEDWWNEATGDLAKAFDAGVGCFADQQLNGPSVPVKFTITPSMTVDVTKSATKGAASGTATGSVTLGFPLTSDFQAKTTFFYIPCLPFVFRPRSVWADGSLTLGEQLSVDVVASGSFSKTYTIPPTGGPQIPIYVIPIVIGDVPVAELDVSAYIEGDVGVKADGKATGHFGASTSQTSTFEFTCDGGGCSGKQKGSSQPITTNASAKIEGQVSAQPGIYAALQLSLDYNVLQGRAGPEPYLLGVGNGCAAVSQQSSGTSSSATTSAVLAGDLDWGVMLRAEAFAAGQQLGNRWTQKLMDERHIWFSDLAPGGSTALKPGVTGSAQASVGKSTSVGVKMPTCYPYTSTTTYRVSWTGNATPAANAACQWQPSGGLCKSDPMKDLAIGLTWQNAGAQSVSVQLVKDEHRTFTPPPAATVLNVNVTP